MAVRDQDGQVGLPADIWLEQSLGGRVKGRPWQSVTRTGKCVRQLTYSWNRAYVDG
jgi:hypothetical protein